jgi:hypothetical protein
MLEPRLAMTISAPLPSPTPPKKRTRRGSRGGRGRTKPAVVPGGDAAGVTRASEVFGSLLN